MSLSAGGGGGGGGSLYAAQKKASETTGITSQNENLHLKNEKNWRRIIRLFTH